MPFHHRPASPDQLAQYAIFEHCSRKDLAALADKAQIFTAPTQTAIIHESEPADSVYVILSGTADVYTGQAKIASVGPGDVIGEMGMYTGGQRRATVTTTSHLDGLRVDYEHLRAVLDKHPALAQSLKDVAADRLRSS